MDCLPGWQYFNKKDAAFTELQYANCRTLIRRDRNHACVLLWEVSLNETEMPPEFIARTQALAHEELPGDQTFTCGWSRGYDVFIQARQHGGCVGVTDVPCLVSEYGDWEYYAQNAGLNQTAWASLAPDDANSRQLRWHGEARMLQQATNFQEAHNDNRKTTAFADGLWVMYDYNRGYAPDIESSGCADIWRVPKFSYHFFRSQRPASERYANASAGPMVFIASHWTPASSLRVRVFSNAEEVALLLNGRVVGRQKPDTDRLSTHLAHPPFTFAVPAFAAGELRAVGYIGGREVASHVVRTPGAPRALTLRLDEAGQRFALRGKDAVFAHASLVDADGTLVINAWKTVGFGVTGAAQLIGANPYSSEAGIASIVLQAERARAMAAVYAVTCVVEGDVTHVLAASCPAGAAPRAYALHVTTDGSAPTAVSPRYSKPISATHGVRAALVVDGRVIASASTDAPRFRVAGSTAPTKSG
jgi:beta-galactosidase